MDPQVNPQKSNSNEQPLMSSTAASSVVPGESSPLVVPFLTGVGGFVPPTSFAMPSAPPFASLQDNYSNAQCPQALEVHNVVVEADMDGPGCALAQPLIPTANARFFTDEELRVLQGSAPPVDYFRLAVAGAPADQVPSGQLLLPLARVMLAPQSASLSPSLASSGVPQAWDMPPGPSRALCDFDGFKGVSSSDAMLHMDASGGETLSFLATHNTRPILSTCIHGYHHERRTRTVSRKDSKGHTTHHTEHYTVTITDFRYELDLSNFIFPFGFIQTDTGEPVPDAVRAFLQDTNGMKQLVMDKVIGFDFPKLQQMIVGYVRSLGWWRCLTVSFPRRNYEVRIWKRTCVSSIWEDPCGKCLCYLSIVGCCIMHVLRNQHSQNHVKAYYRIDYHPLQVFEMIKGAIWIPGFRAQTAGLAMETLRVLF